MIHRFSSRQQPLGQSFLADRLSNASAYDRIAGYFSSSILEIAGEQIEAISGVVRIVCNSELDADDIQSARAANAAIRQEWCASDPISELERRGKDRFVRLSEFLRSGKMVVKVLPSYRFGLIHGKAGVITRKNGTKTSFMGSANDHRNAWSLNYELIWEDDSDDAVAWVQREFYALWNCHEAFPLAEAVIEDVQRLARRSVIPTPKDWKSAAHPHPAAPIIETPVYRKEFGLWAHQKYFAQRAFEAHRGPFGARFVLADMVGLGKTLQLAMSAMLMTLWGDKPVLIIVPKPLLWQWQDEMLQMLDMPSAVWDNGQWVDEYEVSHPANGSEDILRCPRAVGIVSQSLITHQTEAAEHLLTMEYECVIVDEAHRARRRNRAPDEVFDPPRPNNLLKFIHAISRRTRSMLLATATPVQLHSIEAWDLLDALAIGNDFVLGNTVASRWRRPQLCLPIMTGQAALPEKIEEFWEWFRNPIPESAEHRTIEIVRRTLRLSDSQAVAPGTDLSDLRPADIQRLRDLRKEYGAKHNPLIRHMVRRTREFLETEINPETNLPYLEPVEVRLFGEKTEEAIPLNDYLAQAYQLAGEFCELVGKRGRGAGFLKTLLLRRLGSTIVAGTTTANKMLQDWEHVADEDDSDEEAMTVRADFKTLSPEEQLALEKFVRVLEMNRARDPKYEVVVRLLREGHAAAGPESWLQLGCIIFSQYYDSVEWLARELSTNAFPEERVGVYAGAGKSAIYTRGVRQAQNREELKGMVRTGEIRLLIGTDSASEGINLQRLGTLINLDLPWNPTRLEQRKGRIQRIGQKRNRVFVYNMRYRGSVEDRVHELLSSRLRDIHKMFGQIPDTLEDVWIDVAVGATEKAKERIGAIPEKHPFEAKYNQIANVDWESCAEVLNAVEKRNKLSKGW